MANRIQLRRGIKSKLPTTLAVGEPAYTTDTHELFIGTGSGNVNMSGGHWYNGTAMSGTGSSNSYSGCPLVKLGDMYLNTSNGYVYECTTAGSGTDAKWTYKGSIKGANGTNGVNGSNGKDGAAATITIGTVTTGAAGSAAKVTNRGTSTAAILDFTIPKGDKGDNGANGAADYVVTNQSELDAAINAITSSSTMEGHIMITGGKYYELSDITLRGKITIEGVGGQNVLGFSDYKFSSATAKITFKNLELRPTLSRTFVFKNLSQTGIINCINCDISVTAGVVDWGMFRCCDLNITGGSLSVNFTTDSNESDCFSCIGCNNNVKITDCNINLSGEGTRGQPFDINLVYEALYTILSGCKITCSGKYYKNIVNSGINVITGCTLLLSEMGSVFHTTTDRQPSGSVFTGNYVEFIDILLRAGVVSGNQFNDAGKSDSLSIRLSCPTNMTGNTFSGRNVTINGNNQKCIIANNFHDNGLTTTAMGSGSITTNNLQY